MAIPSSTDSVYGQGSAQSTICRISGARTVVPRSLYDEDYWLSERFRRLLRELWRDLSVLDEPVEELGNRLHRDSDSRVCAGIRVYSGYCGNLLGVCAVDHLPYECKIAGLPQQTVIRQ